MPPSDMLAKADCGSAPLQAACPSMNEPPIAREEVIALLFNVSDIVAILARIERLLGDDDGEAEADEG